MVWDKVDFGGIKRIQIACTGIIDLVSGKAVPEIFDFFPLDLGRILNELNLSIIKCIDPAVYKYFVFMCRTKCFNRKHHSDFTRIAGKANFALFTNRSFAVSRQRESILYGEL